MPVTAEQHERKLREPALCELLSVRDYLDNVIVRTDGSFVAGYELKGLTSYFASDEGRDRGKLMIEALLRSLPEQSMRVQFRYEVIEDLGILLDKYIAGQHSEREEVMSLDALRVDRWRNKEQAGRYMRQILHSYFIWDPALHHRIVGKPLRPHGNVFNLSSRKNIERTRQEHHDLLGEFESLLRGIETALEAAELGSRRLSDHELFLETKRALNPLEPDCRRYRKAGEGLRYSSAREQIADVNIVDETDTMSLDTDQTINPFDLPAGECEPSKDRVAFLKNLTRHMLGEGRAEDTELLDNLITEAILRTYKRAAIRPSNPIPTFSDLRDELAQWRDEEKNERVMDEAHLAAIKLRSWTGEKGVYSKLFDRPTTISLDNSWLFFNVEQLSDDPRLETAMSLLIAHATAQRASGAQGRRSITVLDECWFLLDSPVLAPEVVQLFRTARKRNASVWGISQTAEDFVGTESNPRVHGAGIVKNSTTKIIGQQPGDMTALREHLHLNETALNQIKHFSAPVKGKSADALIVIGEKAETTHTIRMSPTPVDYWISTTYARERLYRSWWLRRNTGKPLIEVYSELAETFPFGLADCELLPEELSGQVAKGVAG